MIIYRIAFTFSRQIIISRQIIKLCFLQKKSQRLTIMGGKRKAKQKQNIKKASQNKQTLIQQYFPNICTNKSRALGQVLKKPKGILRQEKKLSKELISEQNMIIKSINSLFGEVFAEADHQLLNELFEELGMNKQKDQKVIQTMSEQRKNEQKIVGRASVVKEGQESLKNQPQPTGDKDVQIDSSDTVTLSSHPKSNRPELIDCRDNKQWSNSFLIDLQQFEFNPHSQQPTTSHPTRSSLPSSKEAESQNTPLQCTQQFIETITLNKNPNHSQSITTKNINHNHSHHQQQTITFNRLISKQSPTKAHIETSLLPNASLQPLSELPNYCYISSSQVSSQQQVSKLTQRKQKLINGISNILELLQRRQKAKQQQLQFKHFVNSLKNIQDHPKTSNNHQAINQINKFPPVNSQTLPNTNINSPTQQTTSQDQQTDEQNWLFLQPKLFSNQIPPEFTSKQHQQQFDILDCILHRKYHSKMQIYPQNQDQQNKNNIHHQNSPVNILNMTPKLLALQKEIHLSNNIRTINNLSLIFLNNSSQDISNKNSILISSGKFISPKFIKSNLSQKLTKHCSEKIASLLIIKIHHDSSGL